MNLNYKDIPTAQTAELKANNDRFNDKEIIPRNGLTKLEEWIEQNDIIINKFNKQADLFITKYKNAVMYEDAAYRRRKEARRRMNPGFFTKLFGLNK